MKETFTAEIEGKETIKINETYIAEREQKNDETDNHSNNNLHADNNMVKSKATGYFKTCTVEKELKSFNETNIVEGENLNVIETKDEKLPPIIVGNEKEREHIRSQITVNATNKTPINNRKTEENPRKQQNLHCDKTNVPTIKKDDIAIDIEYLETEKANDGQTKEYSDDD